MFVIVCKIVFLAAFAVSQTPQFPSNAQQTQEEEVRVESPIFPTGSPWEVLWISPVFPVSAQQSPDEAVEMEKLRGLYDKFHRALRDLSDSGLSDEYHHILRDLADKGSSLESHPALRHLSRDMERVEARREWRRELPADFDEDIDQDDNWTWNWKWKWDPNDPNWKKVMALPESSPLKQALLVLRDVIQMSGGSKEKLLGIVPIPRRPYDPQVDVPTRRPYDEDAEDCCAQDRGRCCLLVPLEKDSYLCPRSKIDLPRCSEACDGELCDRGLECPVGDVDDGTFLAEHTKTVWLDNCKDEKGNYWADVYQKHCCRDNTVFNLKKNCCWDASIHNCQGSKDKVLFTMDILSTRDTTELNALRLRNLDHVADRECSNLMFRYAKSNETCKLWCSSSYTGEENNFPIQVDVVSLGCSTSVQNDVIAGRFEISAKTNAAVQKRCECPTESILSIWTHLTTEEPEEPEEPARSLIDPTEFAWENLRALREKEAAMKLEEEKESMKAGLSS